MEQIDIIKNLHNSIDFKKLIAQMDKADWYYEYSDDPAVWQRRLIEVREIESTLRAVCNLGGKPVANALWDIYVPPFSISKPFFIDSTLISDDLSQQNINTMNEKNFKYLDDQIFYTGFGREHSATLKEKMLEGNPEFVIAHQQDFGKDNVAATIHFKKSKEGDMYFLNSYQLILKNQQNTEPIKQIFYLNNDMRRKEQEDITLKEGYNLLSGRAVNKNLVNKEGEKYNAWLKLDFKDSDKNGNFKLHPYHANYGYELDKVLAKYPIKELTDETQKERLMESLQRGNRQSVTFQHEGKEQKIFIEAEPQREGLNFYDNNMKRINAQTLYENKGEGQSEKKQEAKKESVKQDMAGPDEEGGGGKPTKKKGKRNGQSIS